MKWYCSLSADLSRESPASADRPLATKAELETRVVDLYKQLLLYGMKTVCSCYRHRGLVFLRDIIKLDDWAGELTAIHSAEKGFRDDTAAYAALQTNAHLERLVDQQSAEKDQRSTEQDKQCLQHLRLTDPRDDKKRIQEDKGGLIQDSFRWVLQNPQFEQWRHGPESHLLWIKGSPGKGKTMLLCGIVDELRREMQTATAPSPLSFFFCQAADKDLNNATAVLRGLLYLLFDQRPSLLSHVRKKYDHAGKVLFEDKNAWVALSEVLADVLQDPALESAYLVIDALDECIDDGDRVKLLKFLVQQSSVGSRAKWIVSSRNWLQIEEQLKGGAQRVCLELNAESVSTAVDHFIRYKTNQLSNLKAYDNNTENAIRDYLSLHADGTFLWVALVCKNLESVSRRNAVAKVKTYPPGLDGLYDRMMQHLSASDDAELCQHILAIISLVRRPLTLEELLPFIGALEDVLEPLRDLEEIVGLCGSFLFLRSGQIFFVHQSARDFLAQSPAIFPSGIDHVHYEIFSKSMEILSRTLQRDMYYLQSPGFPIGNVKPPHPDPLAAARYSCTHWIDHYASAFHNVARQNEALQDHNLVHAFLEKKYLYWLEALSLLGGMSGGVLAIAKLETLIVGTNAHEISACLTLARGTWRRCLWDHSSETHADSFSITRV